VKQLRARAETASVGLYSRRPHFDLKIDRLVEDRIALEFAELGAEAIRDLGAWLSSWRSFQPELAISAVALRPLKGEPAT
jgi:hypothetical protein